MANARCEDAKTLKMKCGPPMKASALRASSRMLQSMSGGVSETEANELMVIPSRLPSGDTVVTRQTPVGNDARDCRKDRASGVCGTSPVISVQEYMHPPRLHSVLTLRREAQQMLPHHGRHRVPVKSNVTYDGIGVAPHPLNGLIESQAGAADGRE